MWSKNFVGLSFPRGDSEWEMAPAKLSIVGLSEKSNVGWPSTLCSWLQGSKTTHGPDGRKQWAVISEDGQYLIGSEAVEARKGTHTHPWKGFPFSIKIESRVEDSGERKEKREKQNVGHGLSTLTIETGG